MERLVDIPATDRHPSFERELRRIRARNQYFYTYLAIVEIKQVPIPERFTTNPVTYHGRNQVRLLWYRTLNNPWSNQYILYNIRYLRWTQRRATDPQPRRRVARDNSVGTSLVSRFTWDPEGVPYNLIVNTIIPRLAPHGVWKWAQDFPECPNWINEAPATTIGQLRREEEEEREHEASLRRADRARGNDPRATSE